MVLVVDLFSLLILQDRSSARFVFVLHIVLISGATRYLFLKLGKVLGTWPKWYLISVTVT